MSGHTRYTLRALSDEALLARLDALVGQERESSADVVEHLLEVDRREITLDRGYPSLFEYCLKKLGYSESSSFLRIRAARAAAEFPEILERLRSGSLHLDAIARLYPHLTSDNSRKLLDRAAGASKRDVLALVATLQTAPAPARDIVVAVPSSGARSDDADALPQIVPPPLHRFHFTGDDALFSMIERLKGLLRHRYPDGRLEDIFKEAARVLLEKTRREHLPAEHPTSRRQESKRSGSRLVPRAIKREVWARDGGRCSYAAADGRRCDSRDALEYDHVVPWADGGRSDTSGNIRLLCRAHNQRLGRRRFGRRPLD